MQLQNYVSSFFKASSTFIGLDINSAYIALAEISRRKNKYELIDFIFTPIATTEAKKNTSCDSMHDNLRHFDKILSSTLAQVKFNTKKAIIALPYAAITHKTIILNNNIQPNEIENFLILNSEKYLSATSEAINFDYSAAATVDSYGNAELAIQCFIAKQKEITQYANFIIEQNLQPLAVDIDIYALARAAILLHDDLSPPYIIIHIDLKKILTGLVAQQGQQLDLVWGQENLLEKNIINADEATITFIAEKIHHIISTMIDSAKITAILLCGVNISKKLAHAITLQTNITTLIANPFNKIHLSKKLKQNLSPIQSQQIFQLAPNLLLCCGLALHGINQNTQIKTNYD